jgi:hypothetical protein
VLAVCLKVAAKMFQYELVKNNYTERSKVQGQHVQLFLALQEVAVVWMLMGMEFKISALILQTESVPH